MPVYTLASIPAFSPAAVGQHAHQPPHPTLSEVLGAWSCCMCDLLELLAQAHHRSKVWEKTKGMWHSEEDWLDPVLRI